MINRYVAVLERIPLGFWLSCVLFGMIAGAATVEPLPYAPLAIFWLLILPLAYRMDVPA